MAMDKEPTLVERLDELRLNLAVKDREYIDEVLGRTRDALKVIEEFGKVPRTVQSPKGALATNVIECMMCGRTSPTEEMSNCGDIVPCPRSIVKRGAR